MTQAAAIAEFLLVWGDDMLAHHLAEKLTCHEAEALAELFRAFGREDEADMWISAHAEGDDIDDDHYKEENRHARRSRDGCRLDQGRGHGRVPLRGREGSAVTLTGNKLRIGSLFSGVGGLDLAVEEVFDAETVWQVEFDPNASTVLSKRFGVPNYHDVTAVNWDEVPPVDILAGGFPCQDVSAAGRKAGLAEGTRSGLWSHFHQAISVLRPQYVVIENVRGLLSAKASRSADLEQHDADVVLRAGGAVVGSLADIGYDARWLTLAAGAVGAPHKRERVFILAYPAGS